MKKYPTPGDYQEALQFPETAFLDPLLKQARPRRGLLGLPHTITGAYAAVFPVSIENRPWAVRCFLVHVGEHHARYRALSAFLDDHPQPYLVAFDFQPKGIRVQGEAFPVLKMAWAEGVPLNQYVQEHLERKDQLHKLAAAWVELLASMQEAGIAHGDLQHGNVLVSESEAGPTLRLVDYDTFYVPALKARKNVELGHRNYQHPDRSEQDAGPAIDNFSALVIYTALMACIEDPDRWKRHDNGENMLFHGEDFYDPSASDLFKDLEASPRLCPLAEALKTACFLDPASVPPLGSVIAGDGMPAAVRRPRRQQHVQDRRRNHLEGIFPVYAGAVMAAAVLLFLLHSPAAAVISGSVGTVVLLTASYRQYHALPEVARRRKLAGEYAYLERMKEKLKRDLQQLAREQAYFLNNVETLRAERLHEVQQQALNRRLKYHFVGELSEIEGVGHRTVVRMKAAGIRTAFQAGADDLIRVKGISDTSRARVRLWRQALVMQYRDEVPARLSTAEELHLKRQIAYRLDGIEAERARTQAKLQVQEEEQQQVLKRREALEAVGFGRYLLYLLRLVRMPG